MRRPVSPGGESHRGTGRHAADGPLCLRRKQSAGNSGTVEIDVSGDTNLQIQPSGTGSVAEAFLAGNTVRYSRPIAWPILAYFTTFQTFSSVTTINLPIGSKPIALLHQTGLDVFAQFIAQRELPQHRLDQHY